MNYFPVLFELAKSKKLFRGTYEHLLLYMNIQTLTVQFFLFLLR